MLSFTSKQLFNIKLDTFWSVSSLGMEGTQSTIHGSDFKLIALVFPFIIIIIIIIFFMECDIVF